jgi:hypothetical protein
VLCQPLRSSLPQELQPDQVVQRHLPHTLSPDATQHHLLSKFDKQMLRAFRCEGNDVKFLRHVYGTDSIVYRKAKAAANAQAEEVRRSVSKDLLYLSQVETPAANSAPQSTLDEAENAYWDAANMVLLDTKAWTHLSSSMERYKDLSCAKKDSAARKIQKFLREKMVHFFGWKRSFRRVDAESLRRIRHQAMPPQYQPPLALASASAVSVLAKLQDHTPRSIQALSRTNTCATLPLPMALSQSLSKPPAGSGSGHTLSRPENAPDLHKTAAAASVGRRTSSLRGLLEIDHSSSRPGTAPGHGTGHTFLTEEPQTHSTPSTGARAVRRDVLSMCRQRRDSSVSAMLTARKMLFSADPSAPPPVASNLFEDSGDEEEEEEDSAGEQQQREERDGEEDDLSGSSPQSPEAQPQLQSQPPQSEKRQKEKEKRRRKKRFEQIMFG